MFHFLEPFDLTNTARSVYDYETFERVKAVFVASWRVLQETLDLNSVFSPIMVPSPSPPAQPSSNVTAATTTTTAVENVKTNLNDNFEQYIMTKSIIQDLTTIAAASEYYNENHQAVTEDPKIKEAQNTNIVNEPKTIKSKESIAPPPPSTRNKESQKKRTLVENKEVNKVTRTPTPKSPTPATLSASSCIKNSTKNVVNRNNTTTALLS